MKRLNPETNKPFRHGDMRHDGKVFNGYKIRKRLFSGYFYEYWVDVDTYVKNKSAVYKHGKTKKGHIYSLYKSAEKRAKEKNLDFDITKEYLLSIAPDECPVFKTAFVWGYNRRGYSQDSPTLDRVFNNLGYIKENVVFISKKANTAKSSYQYQDLYKLADWLHDKEKEVLNALQITDAQIPKTNGRTVKENTAHGVVHGTRSRKDCDGTQHYQGELFGEDFGDSSQESGRVSMGARMPEVGSLGRAAYRQADGHTEGEA